MVRSNYYVRAIASMAAVALASSAHAALVKFDAASDLSGNFRDLNTASTLTVTGGVLRVTSSNSARLMVYDTTPGNSTSATHSTFNAESAPVTVSLDLGNMTASGSIGFYFLDASRPETDFGAGGILLNVDNSAPGKERVRVGSFLQATSGGVGGTELLNPQQDIGIGVNGPMTKITATYTRIDNQKSTLALTVGSTTLSQLFTGFWTPKNVEIGFRLFPGATGTTYDVDNVSITVPEPATFASFGGLFALFSRRLRAR